MKNNKGHGFTLVELLAVIVILAVILIIAMPKISEVIKKTRLSSLEATAKLLINQAEKKYTENQVLDNSSAIKCSDVAKLNDTDYGTCKITFDDKGNASVILNGKKDGKFDNLTCSGTKGNITCGEGETSIYRKCTTSDTVKYGLKFVDGQYTYTYNGSAGWRVQLTDSNSTEPVTTELCSTINDKPIVDMTSMFMSSKATSIDLSSFDTSNVTDMKGMFSYASGVGSLDMSGFDTSNVTLMRSMINSCYAKTIIFGDNFDTSNVTDMSSMFDGSTATSLDVSKFDTSKVTDMYRMFAYTMADSFDLTNFDTSNVTRMSDMFLSSYATTVYLKSQEDIDKFNVSAIEFPSTLTFKLKNTN